MNGYGDRELFEKPDLTPLDFCLWDWLNSQVYKRQVKIHEMNCSDAFWMLLPV
jgi:hypothetical protein